MGETHAKIPELAIKEALMDLLKLWWDKNQAAINEERYADATWLPSYKGKPSYLGRQEMDEREADKVRQDKARESRLGDKGKDPNKVEAVNLSFSGKGWFWWSGGAIFALGTLFIFKRCVRTRSLQSK